MDLVLNSVSMEGGSGEEVTRRQVMASSVSMENRDVGLFGLDSGWGNTICDGVENLACSMGRLGLSTTTTTTISTTGLLLDPSNNLPDRGYGHQSFSSFQNVRGQLISLAQADQRLLGNAEEIQKILWQVKDHLCHLMMDHQCCYLIQTIIQASTVNQTTIILAFLLRNDHMLKEVCMHIHGTRAIHTLLENLKTQEQISMAIFAIKRITVRLSKTINGGYVIQHCLKLFSPDSTKFILDEVAKNCVEIASDKSGCSVYQKCLHHAQGEAMTRLLEETVSYALVLAEHPYGNYVVQYVIKMKMPQVNATIISQLRGKFVQLSMNKHASNVVEDLLEFSEERDAAIIVQEIMYNRNFLGILQDPYGNYVVQRALKNCKGSLNKTLSSSILSNYCHLHSHLYGKRVLAFVKGRRICV